MRFVLDQDVHAGCRRVLLDAGHECWTVGEAGRATAEDDDQSVYASSKGAVLVTQDQEFTQRRKRNAIGRHVRIKCAAPDAPAVLAAHLEELLGVLDALPNVTIEVSRDRLTTWTQWR